MFGEDFVTQDNAVTVEQKSESKDEISDSDPNNFQIYIAT
jgi:hypothetical protein